MRKTLLATLLGITALVAAACGGGGTSSSTAPELETIPAASDMLESPSDMLESESPS